MKSTNRLASIGVILLVGLTIPIGAWAAEVTSAGQPPSFNDFPAPADESMPLTVRLILQSRLARHYKTMIEIQAKAEADFAGHYRVATWGCGTDCRGFAIINKLDGRVYTLPGVQYVAGVMGNDEDRLSYRKDSRLFVMTGRKNDEQEGKFYYVWDGKALKLVCTSPVEKDRLDE